MSLKYRLLRVGVDITQPLGKQVLAAPQVNGRAAAAKAPTQAKETKAAALYTILYLTDW
jgi:hypothetical protein